MQNDIKRIRSEFDLRERQLVRNVVDGMSTLAFRINHFCGSISASPVSLNALQSSMAEIEAEAAAMNAALVEFRLEKNFVEQVLVRLERTDVVELPNLGAGSKAAVWLTEEKSPKKATRSSGPA